MIKKTLSCSLLLAVCSTVFAQTTPAQQAESYEATPHIIPQMMFQTDTMTFSPFATNDVVTNQYISHGALFSGFSGSGNPVVYNYTGAWGNVLRSDNWYNPIQVSFVDTISGTQTQLVRYIEFDNPISSEVDYISVDVYDSSNVLLYHYVSTSPEHISIDLGSYSGAYMVFDDSASTAYVVDNILLDFEPSQNPTNSSSSFSVTACDSYTVPSGQATYTTSGVYTDTITNASGGDSIMTITVNMNQSTSGVDIQSHCGSFTWIDSVTYDTTNFTATHSLTNSAGCDSVVTLNLTIAPINANASQSGSTLTAAATGVSYQWIDCADMSAVSGAVSRSFTPSSDGSYAVVVSSNSCVDTSACLNVIIDGVAEEAEHQILVYPNPFKDNFSIHLGETLQSVHVKVTDLTGKEVMTERFGNTEYINLGFDGTAGTYHLIITSEAKTQTLQVIKQ